MTYLKIKWHKQPSGRYCGPYVYEYRNEWVPGKGSVPRYVRYIGKSKITDEARLEKMVREYNEPNSNLNGCMDLYDSGKWFIGYDTETTGLSYDKGARIIELAARKLRIKDGKLQEGKIFHEYVNPGVKIPMMIQDMTGIRPWTVKDSRTVGPVIRDFSEFVGKKDLVAHNIAFDMRMINGSARDHRVKQFNEGFDTMKLSRTVWGTGVRHTLEEVANREGVKVKGKFHSAVTDVNVTGRVFVGLVERFKRDVKGEE